MRTVTRRYKVKPDIIRELIKENGLTQRETAELCGLAYSTLKQTLNTSSGTVKTIGKLADGLGVGARNIAIYPRNRKTAEAATPAADTEQGCIEYNNNDTTDDSKSKGGKLYMYNGVLQDGKRLIELVPEETILEALVAHLKLPVAEVRWM